MHLKDTLGYEGKINLDLIDPNTLKDLIVLEDPDPNKLSNALGLTSAEHDLNDLVRSSRWLIRTLWRMGKSDVEPNYETTSNQSLRIERYW